MADGKIVIETGLDTTGIENGLGKISSLAQKGLATATKTITATSVALSGMGGYAIKAGSIVFNKSRGCYSKFCNVLNKKGYGLFTLRVVILNHEINKHRREWLCIY